MPCSLLQAAWIPVRCRNGGRRFVSPAEIADPAIIALDWSRPDLDAGCRELLIGLLSTACHERAADSRLWREWWREPPAADVLAAAFAPFAEAFVVDGDGPRFMQDSEDLVSESVPADGLIIELAGESQGFFAKRHDPLVLGRAGAAMALYTLQTFAPAGGRGNKTSLRGGGPMTTLVLPNEGDAGEPWLLWRQLWPNVFWDSHSPNWTDPTHQHERLLPWLVATRVSDQGVKTTPGDPADPDSVHPATCFWGMPRRIRLDFEANEERRACDLTGIVDDVVVHTYRTRPNGNDYKGWPRAHPLTPYYRQKPADVEWLAVHPQPGRLGYRDWIGLVVRDAGKGETVSRAPAAILTLAEERLRGFGMRQVRLLASGYDMDNMKARGFVESVMPVRLPPEALDPQEFEVLIRQLVGGAREAVFSLTTAVRIAAYGESRSAPKDGGLMSLARDRFWDRTEPLFFAALEAFDAAPEDEDAIGALLLEVPREWRSQLMTAALAVFDVLVPLDRIEDGEIERVVVARSQLVWSLTGYGKGGKRLFDALGLEAPETKAKKRGRKAA